jgi:hypothetical protein
MISRNFISYIKNINLLKKVFRSSIIQKVKKIRPKPNLKSYDKQKILKLLQINYFLKNDIFIVSYPRSGNTWTRFLIANMMHPDKKFNFRNIDLFVPDLNKTRADRIKTQRFLKTHYPFYKYFPQFIYILQRW